MSEIFFLLIVAGLFWFFMRKPRPPMVKAFPCNNWAGDCEVSCGWCTDNGTDRQNWVYKPAAVSNTAMMEGD